MAKSKPTEAAWIGEFRLSDADADVVCKYLPPAAIEQLERTVADHIYLHRPFLQERKTAPEISDTLKDIAVKAEALRKALKGMDGHSSARLGTIIALDSNTETPLDLRRLADNLMELGAYAAAASRRVPPTEGAGTPGNPGSTVPPKKSSIFTPAPLCLCGLQG
jgi:hypothetical protein